jgi:hypothetical protein
MVARIRNNEKTELVITLSDKLGRVLAQQTCTGPEHAARKACTAIASRGRLEAGDLLRVTLPALEAAEATHEPRALD